MLNTLLPSNILLKLQAFYLRSNKEVLDSFMWNETSNVYFSVKNVYSHIRASITD